MILINLLPHREAARKRRKELFQVALGASLGAGVLVAALVYLWFQGQISTQQERNAFLQAEITTLEGQIKEIATIESEIAALRARQKAVEDLQSDRNLPVHLLNEMVRQLPDGVSISSMTQEGQSITVKGVAQSNERISEFLRNLSGGTPWLSRPELIEITAAQVPVGREQRRVANFSVKVRLMRASEVPAPVGTLVVAPAAAAARSTAATTPAAPAVTR